ncbi:MAG TPA: ribose-5-phosphate isomerase RpiA [bacterium]
MNRDREKQLAAEAAAAVVESGMVVGLGTGSTAAFAIRKLGERVKGGLKMHGVPSSRWAENLAKEVGIPLLDFSQTSQLDITLDGADEFDPALNLIKGGGGALFREKIVAAASKRLVIFADASKQVPTLGKFPLPVEVNPFGWQVAVRKLKDLCPKVTLREKDGKPFVSDNQGYILDCAFGSIPNPPELEARIKRITGVMECGLFCGMADTVAMATGEKVELVRPR